MARTKHPSTRLAVAAAVLSTAWLAAGSAPAAQSRTFALSRNGLPMILHDVDVSTSTRIPDVTVTTPAPPAGQDLAEDSLYQFIQHHATTHYVPLSTSRNLARWRGGKQSICALTGGLDPQNNAFVTARVRAVAAYVGAPMQSDPQCEANVQILFTSNPTETMGAILNWATAAFGTRYSGGMHRLIEYEGDRAIQGWYLTTRGGAIVLNTDLAVVGLDVLPLWPTIGQKYLGSHRVGSRLGGGSGSGAGIGMVLLIVDRTKISGYTMATLADYLAMVSLSVAQSPEHCDPLPSILDVMSPSCASRPVPAAMTAGDLAFLKALYYRDPGLGPSLSRAAIHDNMMRQFELR